MRIKNSVIIFILVVLIFGAITNPNYAEALSKDIMEGYIYGEDGQKIQDAKLRMVSYAIKDNKLTGRASLITATETVVLEFSDLELERLSIHGSKDYIGRGIAHTTQGKRDLNIAIDKKLNRVSGCFDVSLNEELINYNFVVGKNIPTHAFIQSEIRKQEDATKKLSDNTPYTLAGDSSLGDSRSNGIHIQVYGPPSVSRSNPQQYYQIRARQYVYNSSLMAVSYVKLWVNRPYNSTYGAGFNIYDTYPKTSAARNFSVSIGALGISIDTLLSGVDESHNNTQASWSIYPSNQTSMHFYDNGSNSNANSTASGIWLIPIAGSGQYSCTGWVSAQYRFYDVLNRIYITKTSASVPYRVSIY